MTIYARPQPAPRSPKRPVLSVLLVAGVALASTACGATPQQTADTAAPAKVKEQPQRAEKKTDKASEPKGINARYLDPAMDPAAWQKRFEREQREVFANRAAIVKAVGIPPGATIVDVGAGSGAYMEPFSKAVGPNGNVVAVDIAPRFVDHLKARAKAGGFGNVSVHLSKPDDISVAKDTADIVFLCDTYHHFEDPAAILKTIRKALKPGGRLVVIDFHRIEGKTRPWLMEHVRAGQEVFAAEIKAAAFERLADPPHDFLVENYMMVFKN